MYMGGSDAGPDMKGTKHLLEEALFDMDFVWVAWGWCLIHQLHLIAKKHLAHTEHLYSKLAKLANSGGAPHKSAQTYATWTAQHDDMWTHG